MDAKFLPAQAAIHLDDAEELERLIREDPSLAVDRSLSTCDHPTLLCALVLQTPPRRSLDHLIRVFAELGAKLGSPLIAAASINNLPALRTLLDLGAPIEGDLWWSPLEEALYWGHSAAVDLLLERGAPVDNLRKYAALGDLAGVRRCFDGDGALSPAAGKLAWPFGDNIPEEVRRDRRQIINNALVYAAIWGRQETAGELLSRGAEINAIPAGFDFAGAPLHYAALNNRREMADWLLARGADPCLLDTKVHHTPDGWAAYAHHHDLADYLRSIRESRDA
jgi:ankyrin repeat protein